MSYFKQIHSEKMKKIKSEQLSLFDPQKEGREIELESFFDSIFRNNFKIEKDYQNQKTIFRNFVYLVNINSIKNGEEVTSYVCDSLKKVLKNERNFEYFTINQLNSPRVREKENLSSLNAIALDFDLAKDGSGRKYDADELAYVIFNELDKYPHFVWETKTKGDYQSLFLINQTSGQAKYVMLFESIAKRLSIVLGSDYSATVANKLFRIPKKGLKQYENTNIIYDLDDFKDLFENEFINEKLDEFQNQFENNKVINFTEQQLLNSPAIKALMECKVDMRNHACFTLSLFFYSIGWEKKKTESFFNDEWYYLANDKSKFSKRFPKSEIRSCIRSAYSGKYAGASREWIEGLTGHPFNYVVYKSTYISKNVYMKKTELRIKLIDWIRENQNTVVSQNNLAEILNIGLRSLKRNIKELEDEGILSSETVFEGKKRLGSRFELKEQAQFKVEKSNKFNFDELEKLDNIIELTKHKKAATS